MFFSTQILQKFLEATNASQPFNYHAEAQNQDYEGCTFSWENKTFRSRLAKKTPKKKGYFVAFWEKNSQEHNQAYAADSAPDYLMIMIQDEERTGLFLLPKAILMQQGILQTATQKGKMAMRVYPSWELDLNQSARKTQSWQTNYFYDFTQPSDRTRFRDYYATQLASR